MQLQRSQHVTHRGSHAGVWRQCRSAMLLRPQRSGSSSRSSGGSSAARAGAACMHSGRTGASTLQAGLQQSHTPSLHHQQQQQPQRRRRRMVAAHAGAGAGAPRYAAPAGPYAVDSLPVIKVPLGPSPNDPTTLMDLQLEVLTAAGKSPCPVVIFTPGFLLNSSLYRSYAARLASWGYTVVLWDLSEVLDDTLTCAFMRQAIDVCTKDARLARHCDTSRLLLMGHSRGAKLSCLIAENDARVQGLALIDPVDNSSFGPQGVGYPSALGPLTSAAAARRLPVLVVGAALNRDVVPPEANYSRFSAAAAAGGAPTWELVLAGSSHLQFLDRQVPLMSLFSNNGPTPDETVRQITQTAIVAFSELALCPRSSYSGPQVQTLLAEEGEALRRLAPLESRLFNKDQLRGQAAAAAAGAGATGPAAGFAAGPAGSRSSSSRARGGAGSGGGAAGRPKPVVATQQQLMGMRVKELQRLCQEHGVDASDCFEKRDLVQRVLERCTIA